MSASATQGGHKKLLRLSCSCWKKFAFGKENNRLCPNSIRSILALGADPRKIWRYSTRPLNFSHQQSRNACTVYGCASLYMLPISKLGALGSAYLHHTTVKSAESHYGQVVNACKKSQ